MHGETVKLINSSFI